MSRQRLLCVANYQANTSYAWRTIHRLYGLLAARLAPRGVDTLVVHREPPTGSGGVETRDGYARLLQGYETEADLIHLVREHRIDALHLTDGPLISPMFWRLRRAGADAIVMHVRTSGERAVPRGLRRTVKRAGTRLAALTASRYVAVSDFVARRLARSGCLPRRRIVRIHNGIDLGRFSGRNGAEDFARRLTGTPAGTPLLFAAARANRYKGIGVLVEAMARLRDEGGPTAEVLYCGDGPDLASFREAIARHRLDARFHLLGERDDVDRILPGATVAVVPSTWQEAFGLSVVEAMAAGVPVVASGVGGIPEIVSDGNTGLLVPPGDSRALAAAIARLLENRALREELATRARRDAEARFSIQRVASELAGVFVGLGVGEPADRSRRIGKKRSAGGSGITS